MSPPASTVTLPLDREMHPASDRAFERAHALLGGDLRQTDDLVTPERRHLDPARAGLKGLQHLLQHRFRDGRRREAGDHAIGLGAERARRAVAQRAPALISGSADTAIDVVDRKLEAVAQQTCGQMASEIA